MTLDRVLAAGARPFEIAWSTHAGTLPLFVVQLAVLLSFSFLVFKIPLHGSVFLVFALGFVRSFDFTLTAGYVLIAPSAGTRHYIYVPRNADRNGLQLGCGSSFMETANATQNSMRFC